jgi:hypothetical protein
MLRCSICHVKASSTPYNYEIKYRICYFLSPRRKSWIRLLSDVYPEDIAFLFEALIIARS